MNDATVSVVAGVLERADGRVLLAQRLAGKPYAGYWEFPGGKIEPGETPEIALERELHEELGLAGIHAYPWLTQRFVYPHAKVLLKFFRVAKWTHEPQGCDGQALSWQRPGSFDVAPLLPANTPVLRALELPSTYAISMATEYGVDAFITRLQAALVRGLRLLQIREKTMSRDGLIDLIERASQVARPYNAKLLLNGDETLAREHGLAGVHWTAPQLAQASRRPGDLWCGASCHTAAEIERAASLGLDFAVLGPVLPTPTHPHASPLHWDGFARLVRGTSLPVYALGGLCPRDAPRAMRAGGHGIALRRAAWT